MNSFIDMYDFILLVKGDNKVGSSLDSSISLIISKVFLMVVE